MHYLIITVQLICLMWIGKILTEAEAKAEEEEEFLQACYDGNCFQETKHYHSI